MPRAKVKLLILGLDGLDPLLVQKYWQIGLCPALKALRQKAVYTTFLPTLPAVSPAIWTTYFTGLSPQEHGLIDLLSRKNYSYALTPCTAKERCVATIFKTLADKGLNVAALGFPGSYPAERSSSLTMVSGFDAPWAQKAHDEAFSSPELASYIRKLGGWSYNVVNEFLPIGQSSTMAQILLFKLQNDLAQKERIITRLLLEKEWHLFAFHLQTADTAAHHLWQLDDPNSPLHKAGTKEGHYLEKVYEMLDHFVEKILSLVDSSTAVILLSDHGMGGSNGTILHLNNLLNAAGFLSYHSLKSAHIPLLKMGQKILPKVPDIFKIAAYGLDFNPQLLSLLAASCLKSPIDFSKTKVWAQEIDASPALFLNLAGRDPLGQVRAKELPVLTKRLTKLFSTLQNPLTGAPVFLPIVAKEELTATSAAGADFYLPYNVDSAGYRVSVVPSAPGGPIFSQNKAAAGKGLGMPGVHRGGGLLWIYNPAAIGGPTLPLPATDLYKQIAAFFGLNMSTAMGQAATGSSGHNVPLKRREEMAILKQLQRLGYVD